VKAIGCSPEKTSNRFVKPLLEALKPLIHHVLIFLNILFSQVTEPSLEAEVSVNGNSFIRNNRLPVALGMFHLVQGEDIGEHSQAHYLYGQVFRHPPPCWAGREKMDKPGSLYGPGLFELGDQVVGKGSGGSCNVRDPVGDHDLVDILFWL